MTTCHVSRRKHIMHSNKNRTPSLAKHNANRAFTSWRAKRASLLSCQLSSRYILFIYLYIYIFIYFLASEASLSLVMSIELEIYYIYIFIYLLASEASLSLVMSIEIEIYFIYIFIYLYIYIFIYLYAYVSTCHMDLRQNEKTDQQNDDAR